MAYRALSLPVLTSNEAVLPPLYARWMDELLGGIIPPETEATCSDCAMCAGDSTGDSNALRPEGFYFDPKVKCCSYVPELANFIVGQILTDENPATDRQNLEARLATGVAVTPLGLGRHPTFELLYQHMAGAAGFGRSDSIRCPHLREDATCAIWRHRNSVCATWFCKHVRGAIGAQFWNTLQQLLGLLEQRLAQWCLLELDIGETALARTFMGRQETGDPIKEGRLDGIPDAAVRQAMWGQWAGREREFYIECGRRVDALAWSELTGICGPEARALAQLVRATFQELTSQQTPERLRAGGYSVVASGPESARVQTYSGCDPLDVSRVVLSVLHYFDGSPTESVLRRIAMERGIQIEELLVRKLADFRLLIQC